MNRNPATPLAPTPPKQVFSRLAGKIAAMEKPSASTQAMVLGLASAILLVGAWVTAAPAGPLIALAGGALGWMYARTSSPTSFGPAVAEPPAQAAQAAAPEPADTSMSVLRHDLRGILSPAMLIADRLMAHADPSVQRAGEVIGRTVERATARLAEKKQGPGQSP